MYRFIQQELLLWKNQKNRLPLIIRGARQIGKSYVIEKFGESSFRYLAVVNFELQPEFKTTFSNLDPQKIIEALELKLGTPIIKNETLLFLDEIQECPQAIMSLRYFKEKIPDLHVIAAGSLLEFALKDEGFRMPVGRIQYMYMKPLTFKEFLMALGEEKLKNYIEEINWVTEIPELIHNKLIELTRVYFILGGMPAVIQDYINNKSFLSAKRIQAAILMTYRSDFGKYANITKHKYLELLFTRAPQVIANHFRYADVSREIQSRDIKEALYNLCKAGLTYIVYSSKASGLPLNAFINEKRFKLLFLDIGLVTCATQSDAQLILDKHNSLVKRGVLAEQYVGQELIGMQDFYFEPELYYWSRETASSQAEVDYLTTIHEEIIPIEVKAGSTGRMKSIQIFLKEHKSAQGIRISEIPLSNHSSIVTIPFYLVSEINRLMQLI